MPLVNQAEQVHSLPVPLGRLLATGVQEGVFPGGAAAIVCGAPERRTLWRGYSGMRRLVPTPLPLDAETCFDLASLTKPLATTLAVLALVDQNALSLDTVLGDLLEEVLPADKKEITLRHLLSHSSGLVAHRPYYLELNKLSLPSRKSKIQNKILAEPLAAAPGEKAIYSDLGFMLLGFIVEQKSGMGLADFVRQKIYQPLSLGDQLFFRPLAGPWPATKKVAATEQCPWRGRVLEGEVSDDNTHVLGGVAGQAGLFGDLEAVLTLVTGLLDCWRERTVHPAFANHLLASFLERDGRVRESSWALGFDTPSPQGSSSGKYFHPTSVGHLGFSGTSFWIDPNRDLAVVLLTNRIHPSRQNSAIKSFRPRFHDAVIETLC